jgi:phosphopantothenoylcysteine synthetase/decarboxylase
VKNKILVTSGGTREYLDEIRFISNISSGKLGAEIAYQFAHYGYAIDYLRTRDAQEVHQCNSVKSTTVTSTMDAKDFMEKAIQKNDYLAVVHCMACGDFGFTPENTKLKSNSADDFIESLGRRIFVNPKILPLIKTWDPNVFLVSFKFEVNLDDKGLATAAINSRDGADGDLVIANDKNEMNREKEHVAHLFFKDEEQFADMPKTVRGKPEIASSIEIVVSGYQEKLKNVSKTS